MANLNRSHNNAKKLVELESIDPEKLTPKQTDELHLLQTMKKEIDASEVKRSTRFLRYYDKKGNKMSHWDYLSYTVDFEYKIIAIAVYGNFRVSTVWLGVDHSYPMTDIEEIHMPIIFETMIFNDLGEEHELDCYQERYSIEGMAIEGHKEACKLASKAACDAL